MAFLLARVIYVSFDIPCNKSNISSNMLFTVTERVVMVLIMDYNLYIYFPKSEKEIEFRFSHLLTVTIHTHIHTRNTVAVAVHNTNTELWCKVFFFFIQRTDFLFCIALFILFYFVFMHCSSSLSPI